MQNAPLWSSRPAAITPSGSARRRETSAQAPQPLHAMPAWMGSAEGRTVIRISLSPSGSEWALVIAPPDLSAPCLPPDGLTGPHIRPLAGQFALVRVPGPAGPDFGLAALHYRRGQTRTYCLSTQIATDRAACVLSALAAQTIDSFLTGQAVGEGADLEPRITSRCHVSCHEAQSSKQEIPTSSEKHKASHGQEPPWGSGSSQTENYV